MRPVDLNNLIPKAQQVSKLQQIENNKHRDFMHNQAAVQNKKFENELKKVNTSDKAYEAKINNKQKDNRKNNDSRKNAKQKEKEKEKEDHNKIEVMSDGIIGSNIDVKI